MELSNVHRSQHALVFLGLNHCDKLCETGWERNQNADYKDWRELTPDSEHEMFKASAHYAVPTTITRVFVGTLRRRQTTSIVSVQLPSTDKFVHKVSRTHFILSLENGIWHLEDRSTHGTEVNGTQLARDPSSQTSESSASSQATMRSASYVRSRRSCPSKIALHPGIWNDILAGELKLSIRALGPEPYPKLPQDLPSTIPAMTRLCYIVKKYRSYSPGNDTYIAVDKLSGEILEAQLAFSPESIRAMKNVTLLLNPLRILEEPTTSEAPAVIITPQLEAYLPLKETEYSGHINQIISTLDQLADCLIAFKKANIYHENITLDTVLADEDYHNRLHIKLHGLADLKTSHKKDEVYLKCEDDARAVCKTVLGVLKQSKRLGDPQLIDFLAEGSSIDSGYEGLTIKRFLNSVYPPDIRDPFQPVKISCDLPITRVKTKFKKECVDIISLFRDTRGSNHGNHEEVAKCFGSMLSSDNLKSNPCYIRRGRVNELQEQLKKQLFKFNWALEERIEDIVKDSNLTITDTSEVTYYVTVHQPSGMFNISQLLRFCPQEAFERFTKLAPSLHSIKLHSVRGDSTWQGEYINEEAFLALVRALGMSIGSYRSPVLSPTLPPWSVSIRKSMGTHIEETSPDIYTTITTDTTTDTTRIRLAQHPHILLASPDLLHFPVYVPSTKIVLWNNKTLSLATALEKCEKYSLRTIKTALEEISQQSILPSPINPEEQIKEQIETQPKQQIKTRPKTQPKEKIETKPQTQLEEQIKQPALSLILHLASPISHLTSLYESNEEILALIRKYATPNTKPPDRRDKSSDEEDMEFRLRKRVKREAEKGTDGKKGKDVGLDKFGIGRVEK